MKRIEIYTDGACSGNPGPGGWGAILRFRGREMAHTDIGKGLLLKFAEQCAEVAALDKEPKLDGRHMSIFLSPKPQAPAKKPGKPKEPKPEAAEEAKE